MTNKSNKSRADRERAAKMRTAYTNPYKTVSSARRRIQQEVQEERDGGEVPRRRSMERRSRDENGLNSDMITEALRNPTKTVTEAELREQYSHVLTDLRSMGVLAAGLVVVLVTLSVVLPK